MTGETLTLTLTPHLHLLNSPTLFDIYSVLIYDITVRQGSSISLELGLVLETEVKSGAGGYE